MKISGRERSATIISLCFFLGRLMYRPTFITEANGFKCICVCSEGDIQGKDQILFAFKGDEVLIYYYREDFEEMINTLSKAGLFKRFSVRHIKQPSPDFFEEFSHGNKG